MFNLLRGVQGVQYDTSKFNGQVVQFEMAALCPDLPHVMHVCAAMDLWLALSPDNIAVIHCQNGLV